MSKAVEKDSSDYLSEKENLADLVSRMPADEAEAYQRPGHLKIEAGFKDRIFIVYKARGLRNGKTKATDQLEPQVLTTIKVLSLTTNLQNGSQAVLLDETTGQEMTVRHIPKRLFNYPVFISLPADMRISLGGLRKPDGVQRSVSFALLIKSADRADMLTEGNVYIETPKTFKKLFPAVTGEFTF